MCGGGGEGGYYVLGSNAMYVQFKGIKGLETVVLRKFSKNSLKACFSSIFK